MNRRLIFGVEVDKRFGTKEKRPVTSKGFVALRSIVMETRCSCGSNRKARPVTPVLRAAFSQKYFRLERMAAFLIQNSCRVALFLKSWKDSHASSKAVRPKCQKDRILLIFFQKGSTRFLRKSARNRQRRSLQQRIRPGRNWPLNRRTFCIICWCCSSTKVWKLKRFWLNWKRDRIERGSQTTKVVSKSFNGNTDLSRVCRTQ